MKKMHLLHELLEYNKKFVADKQYESYTTTKSPDKKLVLLSCMDTRLTEMTIKALGLKNGDVKHLMTAGGIISHPMGSTMRSILIAVHMLGTDEVMVMEHHDCGFGALRPGPMIEAMKKRGISAEVIETLRFTGTDLDEWFYGYDDIYDSVRENVDKIKNHPLMPKDVAVHGVVITPDTGEIELVVDGYEHLEK